MVAGWLAGLLGCAKLLLLGRPVVFIVHSSGIGQRVCTQSPCTHTYFPTRYHALNRPRTGRTHQIRVHLQHLGHPIANDVQYGGTYGGPMAARQMARELGVHWGGGNSGSQGGTGNGAAAAEADAEAVEAAEAGERSKRPRLGEAPGPVAAAGGQQQPVVDSQQRERQEGDQAPGNGTAAGAARRDAEAYAQNAVFRLSPEYRLPAELCDALCTHCPYYAPR